MWLNWDIDMVSIGKTYLEMFGRVEKSFKRLKFERGHRDDYFWDTEWKWLKDFRNVKEIHVNCATGFRAWERDEYGMFSFCGIENVLLIDASNGQTGRIIGEGESDSFYEEDDWD